MTMQRRKEIKHRQLMINCGRKQFLDIFGKPIESYSAFQRATEGLKESTKEAYRRNLAYYFLFIGEDPDTTISNRKKDLASQDVLDNERYERKTKVYVNYLVEHKISVPSLLARIQGFYTNNSHRLSLDLGKLKYPKARKKRKYSPSNENVRYLILNADCSRDKFVTALIYQNGPAPVDIAALNIGDYPEKPWSYFEFSRSKTGEVWRGVSTPDVCEFLKTYLVVRKGKVGEPLLVGREGPLDNQGVSQVIAELIRKSGLNSIPGFKPTALRDAFEDALSDAKIYHKTKEALMGHTVDIEHDYGGYEKMTVRLVEAMKEAYPLLCLTEVKANFISGLTSEDIENVKEIANNIELYREISDLLKAKKLVHIDDPELAKRLKDEGKI